MVHLYQEQHSFLWAAELMVLSELQGAPGQSPSELASVILDVISIFR